MEGTTGNYTVVSSCDTLEYRHRHPSANSAQRLTCRRRHPWPDNDWADSLSPCLTQQAGRWYGRGVAEDKRRAQHRRASCLSYSQVRFVVGVEVESVCRL
jgi:hypothetical protein